MELFWHWLLAPIDVDAQHMVSAEISWHGRFMTLAWGICIPIGIFIARYLKVLPNQNWPEELDNKFWWHSHLFLQQFGGLAMLVGFFLVAQDGLSFGASIHNTTGTLIVLFGAMQIISGYLRGSKGGPTDVTADGSNFGDHYNMTKRRVVFETIHKLIGYTILIAGFVTIILGLIKANAPNWMWVSLTLFWLTMLLLSLFFERSDLKKTSYAAIWGREFSKH